MAEIPQTYNSSEFESKWQKRWEEMQIYRWNPDISRAESFIVDTPPPTVSGSLHLGHVFSYVHTDIMARYKRMTGMNIMYPMGFDDNGLPTERRVQNLLGISCNPNIPYDPNFVPTPVTEKSEIKSISRRNFIEACNIVTKEDEKTFQKLWKHLGLSVDWNEEYATIDSRCQFASQESFLDLLKRGIIYNLQAPTIWDTTFQTAVAQAELEDRQIQGHFHDISFGLKEGGNFTISTTRPELLAACIAIVAHPTDSRYQNLFGKTAITPLFNIEVPIIASEHADPEKGSGIMMVCTFGDSADLAWWRSTNIPLRCIVGRDGKLMPVNFEAEPFQSTNPEKATAAYSRLVGKRTTQARKEIALLLAEEGSGPGGVGAALIGEPKPIMHAVKFYEKGDLPVEFVTSRQWYCRILDFKKELIDVGRQIEWHPDHMRTRYEHWVNGLNSDWCISRQRYFGVPFPAWYPLDGNGSPDYANPILPPKSMLPIDPMSHAAPGYSEESRGKPNGFVGDPDVMDTWATSSLTPLIVSGWANGDARHDKVFPMDLRPQSHEIIRTWAFYTIAKSWFHCGQAPWKHVGISGWILDPDRKKMSKSKGNVVTPDHLLEKYSSDGVRYWSSRARLGVDTAFDEKIMDMGRKLSVKIFNATKFALQQLNDAERGDFNPWASIKTLPVDKAWSSYMQKVISKATKSFEEFDHAQALGTIEEAFWDFCDNYLELVKARCYSGDPVERRSGLTTVAWSVDSFLRLFAPFCPYVTEEMWNHCPWRKHTDTSVHTAQWPKADEIGPERSDSDSTTYDLAIQILLEIRKAKGEQKKSMRWPVETLELSGPTHLLEKLKDISWDLIKAGHIVNESAITQNRTENSEMNIRLQLASTYEGAVKAN